MRSPTRIFLIYLVIGFCVTYLVYGNVSLFAIGTWVHILLWLPLVLWWGIKWSVILIVVTVAILFFLGLIVDSFAGRRILRKRDKATERANNRLREAGYKFEYTRAASSKEEA